MTKPTLIDIYNFDRINHIETYLNKLQDKVNDIQHCMYEIRMTLKDIEQEIKKNEN